MKGNVSHAIRFELYAADVQQERIARENLEQALKPLPASGYTLEIFQVSQDAWLCEEKRLLVCPTLIMKEEGSPERRITGSFKKPVDLALALGLPGFKEEVASVVRPGPKGRPGERHFQEPPRRSVIRDILVRRGTKKRGWARL